MLKATGPADARRHAHAKPVGGFEPGAISAHIVDARLGIARNRERRGEIGRGIESRRRDRHRQRGKALAGRAQRVARYDDLLARRLVDTHGRNRIGDGVRPRRLDLRGWPSHADGIDARRGRERADHHRHVVLATRAIGHVGEQESAARVFLQPALELPAHERMQLGVFVDRAIDAHDEALRFKQRKMLLKVLGRRVGRGLVGDIEHFRSSCARRRQGTTCGNAGAMLMVSADFWGDQP
jgi:hypothetical protein